VRRTTWRCARGAPPQRVSKPRSCSCCLSYAALLPTLFVPGGRADIKLAAELCAVHVDTGVLLGCTTGRASRRQHWMSHWGAADRRATFREEGLIDAVHEATRELRRDLDLHRDRRS